MILESKSSYYVLAHDATKTRYALADVRKDAAGETGLDVWTRAETIVGARAARARLAREIRRDERCLPSGGAHPRRTPSALDDDDEEEEEEEEEDEGGKGAARGRRGEDEGGEDGTSTDADPLGDRFAWTPASDGESDDYYAATVAADAVVKREASRRAERAPRGAGFFSSVHGACVVARGRGVVAFASVEDAASERRLEKRTSFSKDHHNRVAIRDGVVVVDDADPSRARAVSGVATRAPKLVFARADAVRAGRRGRARALGPGDAIFDRGEKGNNNDAAARAERDAARATREMFARPVIVFDDSEEDEDSSDEDDDDHDYDYDSEEEDRRARERKSSRNGVHIANGVVWEPVNRRGRGVRGLERTHAYVGKGEKSWSSLEGMKPGETRAMTAGFSAFRFPPPFTTLSNEDHDADLRPGAKTRLAGNENGSGDGGVAGAARVAAAAVAGVASAVVRTIADALDGRDVREEDGTSTDADDDDGGGGVLSAAAVAAAEKNRRRGLRSPFEDPPLVCLKFRRYRDHVNPR